MRIRKRELPFGVLIKQLRVVLVLAMAVAVTMMRVMVTTTVRAAWCRLRDASRANGRRPRGGDGPRGCAAAAHGRAGEVWATKVGPKIGPQKTLALFRHLCRPAHGFRLNYDLAARGRKRPS